MNTKPTRSGDMDTYELLQLCLTALQNAKPNDRSARDRAYAIAITQLQMVIGFFKTYILDVSKGIDEVDTDG